MKNLKMEHYGELYHFERIKICLFLMPHLFATLFNESALNTLLLLLKFHSKVCNEMNNIYYHYKFDH